MPSFLNGTVVQFITLPRPRTLITEHLQGEACTLFDRLPMINRDFFARMLNMIRTRWLYLVLFLLLLLPAVTSAQLAVFGREQTDASSLKIRGGFTGRMWSPKGFEPYSLDGFSRGAWYGGMEWRHPLHPLGESWDVIDFPEIEYQTNGSRVDFRPEAGQYPETSSDYHNSRFSIWGVASNFLSIRYTAEVAQAKFLDERADFEDLLEDPGRFIKVWETWTRQFEVGIIGAPSDEIDEANLEIGYYRTRLQWPLIDWNREERFSDVGGIYLIQEDLITEGFYAELHSEPIPEIWPLESRLRVQVGGLFGISARFRLEQQLWKGLFGGAEFMAEWRTLNNARNKFDQDIDLNSRSPRETRLRVKAYIAWQLY